MPHGTGGTRADGVFIHETEALARSICAADYAAKSIGFATCDGLVAGWHPAKLNTRLV